MISSQATISFVAAVVDASTRVSFDPSNLIWFKLDFLIRLFYWLWQRNSRKRNHFSLFYEMQVIHDFVNPLVR